MEFASGFRAVLGAALTAFVLLLPHGLVGAQDSSRLVGVWKSDHQTSMLFNFKYADVNERRSAFLNQIIGKMTITFTPTTVRYTMPPVEIEMEGGRKIKLDGYDNSYEYKVLGEDSDSIAIMLKDAYGEDRIVHFQMPSNRLIWIYSEDTRYPNQQEMHVREYFQKQ